MRFVKRIESGLLGFTLAGFGSWKLGKIGQRKLEDLRKKETRERKKETH